MKKGGRPRAERIPNGITLRSANTTSLRTSLCETSRKTMGVASAGFVMVLDRRRSRGCGHFLAEESVWMDWMGTL